MPQDGEQPQVRRRRADTEGQEYYSTTRGQSAPRTEPPFADTDENVGYPRANTSAVRYTGPYTTPTQRSNAIIPSTPRRQFDARGAPSPQRPTRTTTTQQPKETKAQPRPKRNVHWLFYIGVGMIAALVLWMLGSTVLAWGMQRYNDYKYGIPRTFQTDAVVGHNNDSPTKPSHFIAENLNRQAVVVEFMAGDPAKAVTYVAPVYISGPGGDLAPITLDFRDVNGDGKPDMIIHVHLPNQDQVSVFINDGTKFRPSNGNDKISI